ncbi:hypothetical protein ACJ2A9_19530 [Anaerobacillus sp. MEB173]|uniref:hypothetical protein n=1 Tax=Anaerobacillus sp. MEB173 TaxID=3383345 RepID=UPI003F934C3B
MTNIKKQILLYIFKLCGLTNEHLSYLIYGPNDGKLKNQKTKISRYIVELRNEGFIYSNACLPNNSKLHWLTQKGINFINKSFQVNPRHPFAGFDKICGDFKEGVLKPKNHDLDNHMMFVDIAIKLINSGFYVRNQFYCVKRYQTVENNEHIQKKIKPYGEFTKSLGNQSFAIEIVRSTVGKAEILSIFQDYRGYLEHQLKQNKPIPVCGIYIITDIEEKLPYENDHFWQTIINAAIEGLGPYCFSIKVEGYNKQSLQELYNKNLLEHELIQTMLNEKEGSTASKQDSIDIGTSKYKSTENAVTEGMMKEAESAGTNQSIDTNGPVYTSKYTPWIEELFTRDYRLAKEAVEKQKQELEESKFLKRPLKGLRRIFPRKF